MVEEETHLVESVPAPVFRPGTTRAQNVIVTRSGMCFQGPLMLSDSVHVDYGFRKSLATYATGIGSLLTRGVRYHRTTREAIVFHNLWTGGYYHWMTEALPRLFAVRDRWSTSAIVMPHHAPNPWLLRWIENVGQFEEVVRFEGGRNLWLPRVLIPHCPTRQDEFDVLNLQRVKSELFASIGVDQRSRADRRIFITRRNARWRKIPNEADVVARLEPLGFEIFDFDKLDYEGQVRTMSEAGILVSLHGAGLTNLMFMRPGSHVVECAMRPAFPLTYNRFRKTHLANPSYVRLARLFRVNHHFVFCELDMSNVPKSRTKKITANDYDLIVDVDKLLATLGEIIR